MKTLDPALAEALASGVTTLATCWRIRRRDGAVLGFTDHDRPLVYDGVAHEAASGFSSSEAVARADLSVGGLEVDGALVSDVLTAADIEAGLYDGATVEIDLVDWSAPSRRLRLRDGTVGEISRLDGAFRAEIRSAAHALDAPRGRVYQHRCDADLGDSRCGATLAPRSATVTEIAGRRRFRVAGLDTDADGHFDRGTVAFTSGACAGRSSEIKVHRRDGGSVELELWRTPTETVVVGDGLAVTEGCDKRFETCRDRFANAAAFRGFPHIPGNDFLIASPTSGGPADGGVLVS